MLWEVAEKQGKPFLQGLKPIGYRGFAPGPFEAQGELKPRPPKEKEFFSSLPGHERHSCFSQAEKDIAEGVSRKP
jgi:hypothetical protein